MSLGSPPSKCPATLWTLSLAVGRHPRGLVGARANQRTAHWYRLHVLVRRGGGSWEKGAATVADPAEADVKMHPLLKVLRMPRLRPRRSFLRGFLCFA